MAEDNIDFDEIEKAAKNLVKVCEEASRPLIEIAIQINKAIEDIGRGLLAMTEKKEWKDLIKTLSDMSDEGDYHADN